MHYVRVRVGNVNGLSQETCDGDIRAMAGLLQPQPQQFGGAQLPLVRTTLKRRGRRWPFGVLWIHAR